MRLCLLTQHPQTYSNQSLLTAAQKYGGAEVLDPLEQRISWPLTQHTYDKTINRVSSVEADNFVWTLLQEPRWGQQYNAWKIRQELWDKSRQALWMSQRDLPAIPFFMHRRALLESDPHWQKFSEQHLTAHGWVLKMNRGMRGVGVHFFSKTNEMFHWLETLHRLNDQDFIIQPRLAPGPEFRLTLIGQQPWALLERRGVSGVANFAQGGVATELKTYPQELRVLIDLLTINPIADLLSLDILMSSNGPVISDINTVPGFEQLDQVTGRSLARDFMSHVFQSN
jgi:hypothetical protein